MGILETLKKFGIEIGLSATDPKLIVAHLVRLALGFVGIILVLMILSAGVLFMFSGGKQEKIDKAKKTLFNAFVGLIIILSAYSIVIFVFNAFGKETVSQNNNFFANSITTTAKTTLITVQNEEIVDNVSSCIPQSYTGQDKGNSSFLANGIAVLNVSQPLVSILGPGINGVKISHFQLNGPWNSCDVLTEVTVHHLGTGAVSDVDKIYITDGSMNILTPVQNFIGKNSTTLVLKTPYTILQDSHNNDFFVVINTAIEVTTGTHQLAIYPDNNGINDLVFSSIGHVIVGAEDIISTSFSITP